MKKIKILIIIITFLFSFPIHFMYNWFPNFLTSILFPVNESVWEHMKIIYTSILISSIIEYFIYKYKKIETHNFMLSIPISSIIGIIFYIITYYLVKIFIPHNIIMALIIMLLTYILSSMISYYILNFNEIKHQKLIGILLIIISYLIFAYLTYNPIKTNLFLDTEKNTYGISKK